jgi:hypothetical protein
VQVKEVKRASVAWSNGAQRRGLNYRIVFDLGVKGLRGQVRQNQVNYLERTAKDLLKLCCDGRRFVQVKNYVVYAYLQDMNWLIQAQLTEGDHCLHLRSATRLEILV